MTGIVIPDGGTIGSASDTDAISVASDGKVTLSQPVGGTLTLSGDFVPATSLSHRNRIINGCMRIDQRNAGASAGPFSAGNAGYKGVDRWFIANHDMTSEQVTGNAPSSFSHYLKLTKGNGSNIDIRQSVELPTAGQAGQFYNGSSWTLSFYAKSASGGETLNFSSYFRQGIATGTFTSITAPSGVTLTTSWVRYEVVFTVDANASANDECIAFAFNTTATELHLTGVQLEEGSVATPFEPRSIGEELAKCQRYYEKHYFSATGGGRWSTRDYTGGISFAVEKRISPTVTFSGNVTIFSSASTQTVTPSTWAISKSGIGIRAIGTTVADGGSAIISENSGNTINAEAEL